MIEIDRLSKAFGAQKALQSLNLTIQTGEFFGMLGPNGAGKTTLVKLLSTLLLPTQGEIRIDGVTLTRNRVDLKKKLTMMTQEYSLRNDMNVSEMMELQGRLYKMPRGLMRSRTDELLLFCGLHEHKQKLVRSLSGGMKRKLMLSRALLPQPQILLLDEPTVGLDPISRRQMWSLLRNLNEQGLTIMLTTHYIEEAQALCKRVALLNKGHLIDLDTPHNLIRQTGIITIDEFVEVETKSFHFHCKEEALAFAGTLNNKFLMRDTTLEDVFIARVGKGLEEK